MIKPVILNIIKNTIILYTIHSIFYFIIYRQFIKFSEMNVESIIYFILLYGYVILNSINMSLRKHSTIIRHKDYTEY